MVMITDLHICRFDLIIAFLVAFVKHFRYLRDEHSDTCLCRNGFYAGLF